MNPSDLLLLTIPAAMVTFKLGFLALAVVMIARSLMQTYAQPSSIPLLPKRFSKRSHRAPA